LQLPVVWPSWWRSAADTFCGEYHRPWNEKEPDLMVRLFLRVRGVIER
jgi:hypothetical protein